MLKRSLAPHDLQSSLQGSKSLLPIGARFFSRRLSNASLCHDEQRLAAWRERRARREMHNILEHGWCCCLKPTKAQCFKLSMSLQPTAVLCECECALYLQCPPCACVLRIMKDCK
jgi:hypothetical protein